MLKLADRRLPIDVDTGDRRALKQRILVVELDDRPGHARFAARAGHIDLLPADVLEARLPLVPAEIRARGHRTDFLDDVLTDVGDEHAAIVRIPREALRIADAVGVDLAERAALADKRVRLRLDYDAERP